MTFDDFLFNDDRLCKVLQIEINRANLTGRHTYQHCIGWSIIYHNSPSTYPDIIRNMHRSQYHRIGTKMHIIPKHQISYFSLFPDSDTIPPCQEQSGPCNSISRNDYTQRRV